MRAADVTAGAVLRQARAKAGMTQRELAQRSGVTQSVIAAYETDTREPSVATLAALVESAGIELTLGLGPALAASPSLTGALGHRLRRRRAAVLAIAHRHRVSNIRVFGSVARSAERADSDIDLLVHFPDDTGLFAIAAFKRELEELLGVPVDVVPDIGVKPRMQSRIDADLVAL